jgi:hypothetical protein
MWQRLVRVASDPSGILTYTLRRLPGISLQDRVALDLYDRPAYAYGIYQAARQAKALGIRELSLIEFGVAAGAGLLAMERIAADVHRETGVEFRIFGFDMGDGLPAPRDYRDLPYVYRGGFYPMDRSALLPRLRRGELILGDVRDTVPAFVRGGTFPPIGFISFDLDYYSSTVDALAILSGPDERYLPRAFCYFDDVIFEAGLHSEYTGELLAIREFNEREPRMKLALPNGFWLTRIRPAEWNHQLYVCHRFDHPLYTAFITPEAEHTVASIGESRRARRRAQPRPSGAGQSAVRPGQGAGPTPVRTAMGGHVNGASEKDADRRHPVDRTV